jgi:hypothetical protein
MWLKSSEFDSQEKKVWLSYKLGATVSQTAGIGCQRFDDNTTGIFEPVSVLVPEYFSLRHWGIKNLPNYCETKACCNTVHINGCIITFILEVARAHTRACAHSSVNLGKRIKETKFQSSNPHQYTTFSVSWDLSRIYQNLDIYVSRYIQIWQISHMFHGTEGVLSITKTIPRALQPISFKKI